MNRRLSLYLVFAFICILFVIPAFAETRVLDVNDCIEIAIENNPGLRSAYLSIDRSMERINETRAQYYPSLSMSASTRKTSASMDGDDSLFNSYSLGVSTRYSLYQGGKIRGQNQIAEKNIITSGLGYEISLQDVIYRINQAYYSLLQNKYNVEATKKSLERSEMYLDWAKTRYEAGVATISDVLKVEVELSDAKLNLINAQTSYKNSAASLNNLLGIAPGHEIQVVDDLADIEFITIPEYDRLFEIAKDNRPEFGRLDNMIDIQNTMISMSRADYLPAVSFDAGYSYGGRSISDLSDSWSLGFAFSISLFSGGATKSKIIQEKLALTDLEYQKDELVSQINLSLFQAYNDFLNQKDIIENSIIYLKNAQASLDIAQGGYREGTHSIIELVDAQTSVSMAENRYIRSLADYRISYANMERVLGSDLEKLDQ